MLRLSIFNAARKFMISFGETPSLSHIERMLRNKGWRVILYESDGHDKDGILEMLHCIRSASMVDSFAYRDSVVKLIAMRKSGPTQRRHCLYHECGHIFLGHDLGRLTKVQEREAELFAYYCQNWFRRYQVRLRVSLYGFLWVVLISYSIVFGSQI